MRRAARRDGNDAIITEALRSAGFRVDDYAQVGHVPDKLVSRTLPCGKKWICWVEIKTPKGSLTPRQQSFREVFESRMEFYIARDPEETIRELYERYIAAIKAESVG